MDRPITRHELHTALLRLLYAKRVAPLPHLIETIGTPYDGVPTYGVILSGAAKLALSGAIARITGRSDPTVGNMWLLDESEGRALILAAASATSFGVAEGDNLSSPARFE